MENGEEGAQEEYALIASEVEESIAIRQQEEEHEAALLEMLDEERLQYVGSMVLGMNDALVELTLYHPIDGIRWMAFIKNSKRLKQNDIIKFYTSNII